MFKSFITGASCVAAAMLATATTASAQTTVSGTTFGCFGTNCLTAASFSSAASYTIAGTSELINFAGTTFSGTTIAGGFSVGNFGSLILTPVPNGATPTVSFSTPFSILFVLSAPAGSTNPTSLLTVSGAIGASGQNISYTAAAPVAFTFPGGAGTISVDGGRIGTTATAISGGVTAFVPEPSTWALMFAGFGMVGMVMRRRQKVSTRVTYAA